MKLTRIWVSNILLFAMLSILVSCESSNSPSEGGSTPQTVGDDRNVAAESAADPNEPFHPDEYDIRCLDDRLGIDAVDELIQLGRTPTPGELAQIRECRSSEPATIASPGASDAPTDRPNGIEGVLRAIRFPEPAYEPAGASGCTAFRGDTCVELQWEPVAPLQGGAFTSIAIAQSDPMVLYAGVDSNDMSVFKSEDGGRSWNLVHVTGHAMSVAISPNDADLVLYTILEGPVQRSTNGGETWASVIGKRVGWREDEQAPLPAPDNIIFQAVGIAPDDPALVYTATVDGFHRSGTERGPVAVFRSTDRGENWDLAGTCETCGGIHTIVVPKNRPDEVWVASNNGIQVSRDRGRTWSGNLLDDLNDPHTFGVAVAPDDSGVILAATQQDGIYRTIDYGKTWTKSSDGLTVDQTHKVAFALSDPTIAFVTTHDGVFRTTDAGETWKRRSNGLNYAFTTPIAIDPTDADIVYVGTAAEVYTTHPNHFNGGLHSGFGLFKSTDGGESWHRSDRGINEPKIAQMATDPNRPFALWANGESGQGAFFSVNAGATWRFSPSMASHYPMVISYSRTYPSTMYMTSWQNDGEIMQSTNGGGEWVDLTARIETAVSEESRSLGLLDESTRRWFHLHAVAVAPSDPDIIYLGSVHDAVYQNPACTHGGQEGKPARGGICQFTLAGTHLFKSEDAGETFAEISDGFPIETRTSINVIVVDPENPDIAYAMTSLHETQTAIGIYKTTNGGGSWAAVNAGLDVYTNDLQMDPLTPSILYAATESGVYKTMDGATNWQKASFGLPENGPVIDLALDEMNPLVLYAITPDDLFKTKDGGAHWYPVSFGIPLAAGQDAVLSAQERLAQQQQLDRLNTGHSMYGGRFAQDRTLEIDPTGRVVYVVAKDRAADDRATTRILYRSVLEPLHELQYEFVLGAAELLVNSTSNVLRLVMDSEARQVTIVVAGPPGSRGLLSMTIPSAILPGPFSIQHAGTELARSEDGIISVSYDHAGTTTLLVQGED
jgi:photosystem II stability/assembly factor-like uncharacterized protein